MPRTVYRVYVHMADDEWSSGAGGRLMERLAREQVTRYWGHVRDDVPGEESTVVVKVYEHGGWWLSYAPHPDDPSNALVVVGTANDGGVLCPAARRLGERFADADTVVLADVRREAVKT